MLIAFGVLVCAYGELNLVVKGLILQLSALAFEVKYGRCSPASHQNKLVAHRAVRLAGTQQSDMLLAGAGHKVLC